MHCRKKRLLCFLTWDTVGLKIDNIRFEHQLINEGYLWEVMI